MNIYRTKATILIIFCCLFCLQTVVFAQNARTLSINKSQITIKEALREVERQSKMAVAYNESQLGASKKISLNLKQASLDEGMNQILKGTGFTHKIVGNQIIITQIGGG